MCVLEGKEGFTVRENCLQCKSVTKDTRKKGQRRGRETSDDAGRKRNALLGVRSGTRILYREQKQKLLEPSLPEQDGGGLGSVCLFECCACTLVHNFDSKSTLTQKGHPSITSRASPFVPLNQVPPRITLPFFSRSSQ